MVYEKITNEMIKRICKRMKYYDLYGKLPENKIRIDVTISPEILEKLKNKNRSKEIENLISKYY